MAQLSLVEEYRDTDMLDLSADGRLGLLFSRGRVTVQDLHEKRKVASWKSASWPVYARFSPDDGSVYYADFPQRRPRIIGIGDSIAVEVCPSDSWKLVDSRSMGLTWDTEKEELVRLSLEDCSVVNRFDPGLDDHSRLTDVVVSSKTGRFAYIITQEVLGETSRLPDETTVWVRDLESFDVLTVIKDRRGWPFDLIRFTPDGNELIARATQWDFGAPKDEEVSRFVVFDGSSGALTRTMELSDASFGLVFSPDGSLLLSGTIDTELRNGKQYVRTGVKLYDFPSGRGVAKAGLPWRKKPRRARDRISWGGDTLGFLSFSPDGRRIYASSEDTRAWEIPDTLLG